MDTGLIPAHAGKTLHERERDLLERAHPRSRGENGVGDGRVGVVRGSSPLTRGKHQTDRVRVHSRGLIPAHAGKTCARWRTRTRHRAHPRSRGENTASFFGSADTLGSSPLTRGKRDLALLHGIPEGLIPAHAGKTRQ